LILLISKFEVTPVRVDAIIIAHFSGVDSIPKNEKILNILLRLPENMFSLKKLAMIIAKLKPDTMLPSKV
jgi:hypothetical protein